MWEFGYVLIVHYIIQFIQLILLFVLIEKVAAIQLSHLNLKDVQMYMYNVS